jgi:plasmid stabilization system protein ParE
MTLRTTPAADGDIEHRAEQLELKRTGRGAKFLREYRAVIDKLALFPRMYPAVEDDVPDLEVRNAILEHFKLRVVYVVRETETVIIAVDHTSRGSSTWHSRLTDDLYPEE